MTPDWREALGAAHTADGLQLDGLLIQPPDCLGKPALVWVHGFGANFYHPAYRKLGAAVAELGYAVVIGNTRGHDFGALLEPEGRAPYFAGAAWERLEDSHFDLAAWIDFAIGSGFAGVVLAGHSLGAVKVTAYQAQQQDARVRGLVLASPPLRPAWNTRAFPAQLAQAQQMAANGQAETIFAGPWGPVSAQTFLSLHQFGFDQFDGEQGATNLALIRCPLLVVIGTNETHIATRADLEIIRRNAAGAARLETHVVEGADHFYTQHEAKVGAIVAQWMESLAGTVVGVIN